MKNIDFDLVIQAVYLMSLSLSVVLSLISMLSRVFNEYIHARLLSKVALFASVSAFVLSFLLEDIKDPIVSFFTTGVFSLIIIGNIFLKNVCCNIGELDSYLKKTWIISLTVLYAILTNSLTAFVF